MPEPTKQQKFAEQLAMISQLKDFERAKWADNLLYRLNGFSGQPYKPNNLEELSLIDSIRNSKYSKKDFNTVNHQIGLDKIYGPIRNDMARQLALRPDGTIDYNVMEKAQWSIGNALAQELGLFDQYLKIP